MENTNFKSTILRHKAIAISATVLFHVALFGALSVGSSVNMDELVPAKVKQWLDADSKDDKKESKTKKA